MAEETVNTGVIKALIGVETKPATVKIDRQWLRAFTEALDADTLWLEDKYVREAKYE